MSSRPRSSGSWSRIWPYGSPGSTPAEEHLSDPEQLPTLRGLQHSDHESGPGARRRGRDCGRRGPVTYYEFAETLQGTQFEEMMPINDSRADANYKSVELAAVKRLSNRWQFMASYSATKKNRPFINTLAVGGFSEVERILVGHRRGPQSQRRIQPGRSHLGLGCQVLGFVHVPGRRAGVGELPPFQRRPVRRQVNSREA